MGKWKDAFEATLLPASEREYGEAYIFGPPAAENELEDAEKAVGHPFPEDLRQLLREFNGIRKSDMYGRELGHPPSPLFLDTASIAEVIQRPDMIDHMTDRDEETDYLSETGEISPDNDIRKVAWFWETNGGADRYGIVCEEFEDIPVSSIVKLDHESSGFIIQAFPDLLSFLRSGKAKW